MNFISIDNEAIKLYRGKKLIKSLAITDLKRIIVVQVNFHGAQDSIIIFDNGTYYRKRINRKKIFAKHTKEQESWIAIEYSTGNYETLKSRFSKCPIEILPPDD